MDKDPNPQATGPTKWRAENCTTHHHGCDCREWEHACAMEALERDAGRYRWLIENCSSNGGQGVEIFIGDEAPDATELGAMIDAAMQGANA